jgi:hypothetical protein
VREDGMQTMKELQEILAGFGGLPHWGKHFVMDVFDLKHKVTFRRNFSENSTKILGIAFFYMWNLMFLRTRVICSTDKMNQ